jgi:hypothetical protein
MTEIVKKPAKAAKPKKTSEERKAALDLRTMGRRVQIALCIHGINEKYCKSCLAKASAKSAKKAKPAAESAAPKE